MPYQSVRQKAIIAAQRALRAASALLERKYRCSRDALDRIAAEIKTHDVFKKGNIERRQMSVKHQLMTLLHFVGCEGESNST
jgi:hypothetical protein